MQHQELEAPAALQDAIQDFWYLRQDFGEQPGRFEVTPDGCAEIIFHFGQGCSLATPGGPQSLPSPFLVGLLNQPIHFHAQGRLEVIGIKCFPWAVFELLGLPAGPGGVREMAHPIARLQAPLAQWLQAGNVAAALAEVCHYFEQARPDQAGSPLLSKAGGALRAAGGTLPVSQVAEAAHATVRTLERRFKQAAGRSVKDISGLMRFEQARDHLWLHPTASLAGLAQDLGYTDQSHLGREFKRYSGTTPAAFARKATRWQQTVSTDFVAFMLA
ncbi:helix-turn-helix domain-containing protein [Hymenobacter negativus]|uniref:AraC family transcriptional regulator n=1 Tax=Hymenobacter negativus TaxID=2795026 RepID=A0ABS0Q3W8_9BACT|nr:helix-turn-helix domain-containing protein [Hymenobacter negativus]MBH8556989.1 AraC family transcriptional regulator [Hymenobacter negativus]